MIKEAREVRDIEIAKRVAAGVPATQVAEEFCTGVQNVNRILKKDRSREIIEAETKKMLGMLPVVTEQLKNDFELSAEISKFLRNPQNSEVAKNSAFESVDDMLKFQNLAYKKQQDVMKTVGIYPTNSTNVFIQQIYNDNRKQVLTTEVFQALGKLFQSQKGTENDECEEAELVLDEEKFFGE